MTPRRSTSESPSRVVSEESRALESEIARSISTEYQGSPTSTGDPIIMETTQAPFASTPIASSAAMPFGHHHNGETETVARLLADILARMRSDPHFHPPALGPKALLAIAQYQVTSLAMNPGPAPIITDPIR